MDSLERLAHSLDAAVALIHSLRRENRDLAKAAAKGAELEAGKRDLEAVRRDLDEARSEIERLRQEPALDLEAQERSRQAELESAGLAARLEEERQRHLDAQRQLELRIGDLELKLLAAERFETMPMPLPIDRSAELESLAMRCAELELRLGESQAALEKSRGDITAMQVRIAESADPSEVSAWQQQLHDLSAEVERLRHLSDLKEKLDAEKADIRRQRKSLAAVFQEREMTRKRLDEIHAVLDNLRLS